MDTLDDRKCLYCNKSISWRGKQARYCSSSCYYFFIGDQRSGKKQLTTCINCKKEFMPKTRRKTKFCTYRCGNHYHSGTLTNPPKKKCMTCNEPFIPTRAVQIYCKPQCKIKMYNEVYRKFDRTASVKDINALPEPVIEEHIMTEAEIAEGVAKLKPPPGFEQPIISTLPNTPPRENNLPVQNESHDPFGPPADELPWCKRCTTKRVYSLIDDYCSKCDDELAYERESIAQKSR